MILLILLVPKSNKSTSVFIPSIVFLSVLIWDWLLLRLSFFLRANWASSLVFITFLSKSNWWSYLSKLWTDCLYLRLKLVLNTFCTSPWILIAIIFFLDSSSLDIMKGWGSSRSIFFNWVFWTSLSTNAFWLASLLISISSHSKFSVSFRISIKLNWIFLNKLPFH